MLMGGRDTQGAESKAEEETVRGESASGGGKVHEDKEMAGMNRFSDDHEAKLDLSCKRDGAVEWDFRKKDVRAESECRVEVGSPMFAIGEDHVKTRTDQGAAQARFWCRLNGDQH